jgi:hypothetical protein
MNNLPTISKLNLEFHFKPLASQGWSRFGFNQIPIIFFGKNSFNHAIKELRKVADWDGCVELHQNIDLKTNFLFTDFLSFVVSNAFQMENSTIIMGTFFVSLHCESLLFASAQISFYDRNLFPSRICYCIEETEEENLKWKKHEKHSKAKK